MTKSIPTKTTSKPKAAAKAAQSRAPTKNVKGKAKASATQSKQERALTPKQEAFCLAYIETGNASEAYRLCYSAENMKAATVNVKASELLANGKITVRVDELRKPAVESAQMTLEGHLADLKMIRDMALSAEQYSAAITAETNRGKASGLYTEKVEHSGAIQVQSTVTFVTPKHAED